MNSRPAAHPGAHGSEGSFQGGSGDKALHCSSDKAASIPMKLGDADIKFDGLVPMSLSSSYGSTSTPSSSVLYRGSPRPTRDEACALWEIMASPPQSLKDCSQDVRRSDCRRGREDLKRSLSMPSPTIAPSYDAPARVSPRCIVSSASHEASLYGPPYESSLPSPTSASDKRYTLQPRRSRPPRSPTKHSNCASPKGCQHYGIGPLLSLLPESIVYSIISYIHYSERHPTLVLVSQGMTRLLARPEFLFEMKHAHKPSERFEENMGLLSRAFAGEDKIGRETSNNELLLVVGGKCPTKAGDGDTTGESRGDEVRFVNAAELLDGNRRMVMTNNEQSGIMAYDPHKGRWMRFGGDPMKPMSGDALHPLSPCGIVGSKPLYLGHPHYSLVFFGGTQYDTGAPSSRVVAYSFLTGKWGRWADMMRARHGEDFVVARVEGSTDSVVLIGCDLELCDCFRCNPPANVAREARGTDVLGVHTRQRARQADFDTMGRCEVLDLTTGKWERRKSRAPSCPPDDGGVAVIGGRYVYMPGTCPPPPTPTSEPNEVLTGNVTPLTSSEDTSRDSQLEATSMDTESDRSEDDRMFRSLHYRPGLRYDFLLDRWDTLPPRPYVTTSSPTTCSVDDRVVVLGGYRSSSENALSCYRHREEDSILDYEDHLDYAFFFDESSGEWTFGGGSTMFGHRQAWSHSSDMAQAVAAASAFKSDGNNASLANGASAMPCGAPVPVRGATATIYQGRLTLLGGLSTFSRTFYDSERKSIWQFFPEHREWRRAPMTLPVPALLDGYAFSAHI